MVKAGTAVKADQRGALTHRRAVRDELRSIDIKEEANVGKLHVHGTRSPIRRSMLPYRIWLQSLTGTSSRGPSSARRSSTKLRWSPCNRNTGQSVPNSTLW